MQNITVELGIDKGLEILSSVKKEFGLRVLTNVHEDTPIDEVASMVTYEELWRRMVRTFLI
ncbi:hypothetical protein A3712_07090 [Vibrio sp. HI00D65]|nr:hypothetical protein A3712_07090 [Vibrio sp. HI00D65]